MPASKPADKADSSPRPQANPLPVGQPAPVFEFEAADGTVHSTAELLGRPFVVYFYPKDDTPGCTVEACSFRDNHSEFAGASIPVIGVSTDSARSHTKFRKKYDLPFGLAADTERTIVQAYGVWGERKFMGRAFLGTHRVTFLVGADGRIAQVWPKVKPEGHAAEVLAAAAALPS